MAEFKKVQPLALARALVVARKKCRELEKLIRTLTQNTNQEEIVKLPEACYCCRGYDRPCLQNIPTNGMPLCKQGFVKNSQSSSTLPPVAPKEANKHPMGIPTQVNKASDMDLSNWDITCTEFRPRKRKRASKSISVGAYPASPPATESVKKEHKCFNCGKPDHFARLCKQPRRFNLEPPTTQVQVDDDISPQP